MRSTELCIELKCIECKDKKSGNCLFDLWSYIPVNNYGHVERVS